MKSNDNVKRNIAFNMIWAVLAAVINLAVNFLITPYITENVGVDAYGFVTLATNITSYIDIIAISINAFASRYIAISYHKKNFDDANIYFNSVLFADMLFSFILFIPSFFFVSNIQLVINVPERLLVDVKLLFGLVFLNYTITIIGTVFSTATFIKNRIDKSESRKAISHLIKAATLLVLCSAFAPHVWYVGIGYLIANIYIIYTNCCFTRTLTPELKVNFRSFSLKHVKEMISIGIWNSFNSLGNVLNDGLDLLISNIMLSANAMGQISVGKNFSTIYYLLLNALCNAFKPQILKEYAEGNIHNMIRTLKKSMKMCGLITCIIFASFISCGKTFLQCWIPTQDIDFIYNLAAICLGGNLIVGSIMPLFYVNTLTKRLKVPSIITILMGIANVVSMYFLLRLTKFGAYSVVLTTAVLNTFVHVFDTPLYTSYCLKIPYITFYPEIGRHLCSTAITSIGMILVSRLFPAGSGWSGFFIQALICLFAGSCIAFVTTFSYAEIRENLKKRSN